MDPWLSATIAIFGTLGASSGFWAWLSKRSTLNQATTRLIMGLAYHNIVDLGMLYINRGSITKDEYEDFRKYFYEPYIALGGNGVAERIMEDVKNLPFNAPVKHLTRVESARESN